MSVAPFPSTPAAPLDQTASTPRSGGGHVPLALRAGVAWVLCVAAIGKAAAPDSVAWLATALSWLGRDTTHPLAYGLSATEILLAAGLLLDRTWRVASLVTLTFLVAGAASIGWLSYTGGLKSCGCFGAVSSTLSWLERPSVAVGRNLLMIAALLIALFISVKARSTHARAEEST